MAELAKIEPDPIGTALIAAGVTSASIEALAKDYGELAARTQPLETPEEYEVVKRAQLSCRDVRTAVTAALKTERDEAVRYQKFVIQEEKRILAQIATTEEPLKKLREDYDNRILLAQQEEARQWQEKMNLRKQAAFDVGYTFNGSAYLLDRENGEAPWVLREDQVAGMAMSDEALYALLEAQAAELKMTQGIKAEAEAKAEEERQAQEAEVAKRMAEMAAAQEELERKQREMEAREAAMNAKVNEARKNELIAAGMTLDDPDDSLPFGPALVLVDMCLPVHNLHSMTDEQYAEAIAEAKRQAAELEEYNKQKAEVERLQREQQEKERLAREEAMKAEAAEEALRQERQRVAAEQERQEKEKERLAQQEAEERAQRGDVEKVMDFLAHTQMLIERVPELKSAIGQSAMRSYTKQLMDIHASMVKLSKEL